MVEVEIVQRGIPRSARCPYPECASIIVAWLRLGSFPPPLHTQPEVERQLKRSRMAVIPAFIFAEAILLSAILCSMYAIEHATASGAVVLGACALSIPATFLAVMLARHLVDAFRRYQRLLGELGQCTIRGIKLRPSPFGYR